MTQTPAETGSPTNHITRRTALTTGVAVAAALPLAACGAGGAADGAPARRFTEPVTLDFQHRWEAAREPLVQQQVQAFAAVQPNVKINNQLVWCSGTDCPEGMPHNKILTQIAAGTSPDVIMIGSDYAALYATRNALRAVDDLAKRDKIDLPKTFYPALVAMATNGGKVNGLPQLTANDRPYLYAATQVWQEAGLDPNKGPETWEDFLETARKLTKRGEGPAGIERAGFDWFMHNFYDWAVRNNTQFLSPDASKVLFDGPEAQETLEFMRTVTKQVYGSEENRAAFLAGVRGTGPAAARVPQYTNKLGMWGNGVWGFFTAKEEAAQFNPTFKYTAMLAPHNAKNRQAKLVSVTDRTWLYAIPNGSKHVDAAWEWLKYITMGDGNHMFVKAQGRPSGAIKINQDPEFARENPYWNTVVKKALEIAVPLPQTPAWTRISSLLNTMTADVLSDKRAPREALQQTVREAQAALDELKR